MPKATILTLKEAAEYTGRSEKTIMNRVREKKVNVSFSDNREMGFSKSDLDEFFSPKIGQNNTTVSVQLDKGMFNILQRIKDAEGLDNSEVLKRILYPELKRYNEKLEARKKALPSLFEEEK